MNDAQSIKQKLPSDAGVQLSFYQQFNCNPATISHDVKSVGPPFLETPWATWPNLPVISFVGHSDVDMLANRRQHAHRFKTNSMKTNLQGGAPVSLPSWFVLITRLSRFYGDFFLPTADFTLAQGGKKSRAVRSRSLPTSSQHHLLERFRKHKLEMCIFEDHGANGINPKEW